MAGAVPLLIYHWLVTLVTAVSIVLACAKRDRKVTEVSARPLAAKEPDWEHPPVPPPHCPQIGSLTPPEPKKPPANEVVRQLPEDTTRVIRDEDMAKTAPSVAPTTPRESQRQSMQGPVESRRESEKEPSVNERGEQLRSAHDDETLEMVVTNFGDEHTVRQKDGTTVQKDGTTVGEQTSVRQTDNSAPEPQTPSIAEAQKQIADDKRRSTRMKGSRKRRSSRDKRKRKGSKKEEYSDESDESKERSERDDKRSKTSLKRGWMKRDSKKRDTKMSEATQLSTQSRAE